MKTLTRPGSANATKLSEADHKARLFKATLTFIDKVWGELPLPPETTDLEGWRKWRRTIAITAMGILADELEFDFKDRSFQIMSDRLHEYRVHLHSLCCPVQLPEGAMCPFCDRVGGAT